jgi:hypothetical protein
MGREIRVGLNPLCMTNFCCICNNGLQGNYSGLNVRSWRRASRSTSTRRRHAGCPNGESQRDSGSKPRVARHALPWVIVRK